MRKVLVPLICLGLFFGGWLGALALAGQASSPPPVNAPTHVGQQTHWATDQALLAGCRGWNGVQIPCEPTGEWAMTMRVTDFESWFGAAWTYGIGPASTFECAWQLPSLEGTTYWNDCMFILDWAFSYSEPVMQYDAFFGYGTAFIFSNVTGGYIQAVAF